MELRLLPLLPAATEIVHALGLGDFQIGRSHECNYPASVLKLPVCTKPAAEVCGSSAEIDRSVKERLASALSLYDLDIGRIAALRPTHILTQTQCKVCAVSLEDVERAFTSDLGSSANVVALEAHCLNDLWGDINRVAAACGYAHRGQQLVFSLQSRLQAIQERALASSLRPRVASIEWFEPLMAGGNWVPELIELAGGVSLFSEAGHHSPCMTWQQLAEADPDVVVGIPCGFDLARTRSEMHWLTERAGWQQLKAVREGQVYICNGDEFMNRPGPRLVESAQIFAEILHSELFEPALKGVGWEKFPG